MLELTLECRIGARKVVVFDHIVRHEPYYPREKYSMGIRGPAMRPHIDVTRTVCPPVTKLLPVLILC